MEAFFILLVIFGSLTAWRLGPRWLQLRHEERLRMLETKPAPKALTAERDELLERVRHLESVVCSVDFELNAKLNRISTQQLALPFLPASLSSSGAQPAAPVAGAQPAAQSYAFYHGTLGEGARIAGRFVIRSSLGQGGMGAVYQAFDESLNEVVAIKVIRESQLAPPEVIARFRREVSLARRIQHPNVVRIHDLGEEGGLLFLSMQLVRGTTLRALLERHGHLPVARVRLLLEGVLAALEACHEAGIVHRDVKPDNLLVNDENVPILIDFGLARLEMAGSSTATQAILGTPDYMAPEQIRGESVDARSDLYAVGVMAYEMLGGKAPFSASTPIAVGFAHCTKEVPPLELVGPTAAAWSQFVHRALEKEPARRFSSAREMRQALPSEG